MDTRLIDLLRRGKARFDVLQHPDVYTAAERVAVCQTDPPALAKVVVVHDPDDDWFGLAVLPATALLDVMSLREFTGRPRLVLAREAEFGRLFPGCELGAMPAFGRIYGGLEVFLDRSLAGRREIICEAGTHHEEIRIPMDDYLGLEQPAILDLTLRPVGGV